jgi:hypothetical protein
MQLKKPLQPKHLLLPEAAGSIIGIVFFQVGNRIKI